MRGWAKGLLACVAIVLAPNASFGSLITYNFTGVIRETLQETTTFVNGQPVTTTTPLASVSTINAGDTFFGSFQFETSHAAPDGDPNPNEGFFSLSASPVSSMTVTIDGLTFTAGPGFVATRNNVVSSFSPTSDILAYIGGTLDTLPAGWSAASNSLGIAFGEASGTLYSSDALPTTFDPADFDIAEISLGFFSTLNFPGGSLSPTVRIYGDVSLQSVPEPSSLLLVGAAGGLGWVVRRRRQAVRAQE